MGVRSRARRTAVAVALTVGVLTAHPGAAGAALQPPAPPPNPTDEEIERGRESAAATATEVGELANQLAEADAALLDLQAGVALAREEANRALVELEAAQGVADAARREADATRVEAQAATDRIRDAQGDVDAFAAGSYRQGSTVGSVAAFLGSESPEDLLARAEFLDAVGGAQLDALDLMRRARTDLANRDSEARDALEVARAAEDAAQTARAAADTAYQGAVDAEAAQAAQAAALQATKSDLERRLFEAQNAVAGLEGQRQRYDEWQAERARAQAAAEAAAAEAARAAAAAPAAPATGPVPAGAAASGGVRTVIDRALSQLGVVYAWGGGNASGPTRGIRDGGVADSFGDYGKVGFDCSGLMIYAFAGVGIRLPHYSGAQHDSGRKVPLAQVRPGDMLFWSTRGRIHHVALYIGDGQMVEAPYSGARVRVTAVRYGGIVPYATRLL